MLPRIARRLVTAPLLLSLVLAVGLLPAYGATGAAQRSSSSVTLQVWWEDWGVFNQPTKSIGDLFSQSSPGIQLSWSFNPNLYTKLETAIAAGSPPDCAVMTLYNGTFARFVSNGLLTPLDKYYAQAHMSINEFAPVMRDAVRFKGHIYAIPADYDGFALYYNKDMFRKFGLDPNKPPRTWAELEAMNAKFTKESNGNLSSIGIDMAHSVLGDLKWSALANGGRWFDAAHNKVTANDPRNVQALEWLTRWAKKFNYDKVARLTSSQPSSTWQPGNLFVTGKMAFSTGGWWDSYPLDKYGANVDYGVTYVPTPTGAASERANYPLEGWTVAIPKGSRHPDQCWAFEKWGFHDHDDLMAVKTYSYPDVLAQIPSFMAMLRKQEPNDRILKYMDVFNTTCRVGTTIFPIMPVASQYATAVDRATDLAAHGKKEPRQALTEVQTQMQSALDQFLAAHH